MNELKHYKIYTDINFKNIEMHIDCHYLHIQDDVYHFFINDCNVAIFSAPVKNCIIYLTRRYEN